MGIIAIQVRVSQPFTRRMNAGSPWMDAHSERIKVGSCHGLLVFGDDALHVAFVAYMFS